MPEGSQLYAPHATPRDDRRLVTAAEFAHYQSQGFLVCKGLVSDADVAELKQHAMDLYEDKVQVDMEGLGPTHHPGEQRMHQLHRMDATMERFLLHPRVVDVVEALTGPDVLALQTMQFFNAPQPAGEAAAGGQGWHQDSKYIATYPDTLIGTWLALDTADEENGCLWVVSRPPFLAIEKRSLRAPLLMSISPDADRSPGRTISRSFRSRAAPPTSTLRAPSTSRRSPTRPTWTTASTRSRAWRTTTARKAGLRCAWIREM